MKSSFLAFLANFIKNFAFKSYSTLKMLIFGNQDNFHIILSYYVEGHFETIGLANSLLYVLEESRELKALVCWVIFSSIGFEKCKKKFPFLFSFEPPLWIY